MRRDMRARTRLVLFGYQQLAPAPGPMRYLDRALGTLVSIDFLRDNLAWRAPSLEPARKELDELVEGAIRGWQSGDLGRFEDLIRQARPKAKALARAAAGTPFEAPARIARELSRKLPSESRARDTGGVGLQ